MVDLSVEDATMPRRFAPVLTAVCLAVGAAAHAQSLAEREAQAAADAKLAEILAATNAACGTQITAGFVSETFRPEDDTPRLSLAGYCGHPLEAMRDLCQTYNSGHAGGRAACPLRTGVLSTR